MLNDHDAIQSISRPPSMRLEHGGRLLEAAARYGIPWSDWLDLSTGINPDGWPVPPVLGGAWQRLPEDGDGLEAAAAAYYGTADPLPVAGSQAAIQVLPSLRPPGRVGIQRIGYQEHAAAWRCAGHTLVRLDEDDAGHAWDDLIDRVEVLVLIHPNNPTGRRWPVRTLLDWHARLSARGGWLIVDEAFMDATPAQSLALYSERPGLIVLRSLGKFFGLAGARVGFVLARRDARAAIRARLGPWTVSGPARLVARLALADRVWQEATRVRLGRATARLVDLLRRHQLPPSGGTELFQWVCTADAPLIQDALARRGIWVRRFTTPPSLRFGLPGTEEGWCRLARALEEGCAGVGLSSPMRGMRGGAST